MPQQISPIFFIVDQIVTGIHDFTADFTKTLYHIPVKALYRSRRENAGLLPMEVSRHWRLQEQRYKLVGETCPYMVALVKLEEGPIVTAQLTDLDENEVQIGIPVEMVTRKLRTEGDEGMIIYGYKFRPMMETAVFQ